MVLLAIHGRFLSSRFHCLLSALYCGSNMCTQVSSPVSKLEITRLLQPLYVFKSSQAHLKPCDSCSFWYASTTRYIFGRQSRILLDHNLYSSDVSLGNRGFRPSRTCIVFKWKFPKFKSINLHKNCAHWNGLRSIYTTQFIKYLLWIYIKKW